MFGSRLNLSEKSYSLWKLPLNVEGSIYPILLVQLRKNVQVELTEWVAQGQQPGAP
jgi:hypothetical protein